MDRVVYKGRTLDKGDPDTNIVRVIDPRQARVLAWAVGRTPLRAPYIVQSRHFWLVADSPFSYSSEGDRYLAFADVLHEILGIDHAEDHRAILRIEDINALSRPAQLSATLDVIRRHKIPFAFGFVPTYVNPTERLYLRLADMPKIVAQLQIYVQQGGAPILHGYTHQRRGVTTDDYEFWDDFADRPVRDDSDAFVAHRLDHALRESAMAGLYPIAWETPHYAASMLDYRVMRRYFDTVFERRLVVNSLGTDQLFPYPVVDLYGQYVIPENLSYVPQDIPTPDAILKAAAAAWVVRDGYASFFYHPFLKPELLDALIEGIEKLGFRFFDVRRLPNMTHGERRGRRHAHRRGRDLRQRRLPGRARRRRRRSDVAAEGLESGRVRPAPPRDRAEAGTDLRRARQETMPPSLLNRLVRLAKGDFTALQRRWESVLTGRIAQEPVQAVLLWNPKARGEQAKDQESFRCDARRAGFPVEKLELSRLAQEEEDFGPFTLLVVPSASAKALSQTQTERIARTLKGGITLVTDGESPLSRALGVRLGEASTVNSVTSRVFANEENRWADHPAVPWVAQPAVEDDNVYYADRDFGHPLVIGGQLGQGRFLYFAPLYDPLTGGRLRPFPGAAVPAEQRVPRSPHAQAPRRRGLFRPRLPQQHQHRAAGAALAALGHPRGARRGLAFLRQVQLRLRAADPRRAPERHPRLRLARVAAHQRVLLEPPSRVEGEDRAADRRPAGLALSDEPPEPAMPESGPGATSSASCSPTTGTASTSAELTFESQGPEHPESFTPFSAQARAGFQKQSGFDPGRAVRRILAAPWAKDGAGLKAFYDYRRSENRRLLGAILGAVDEASRGRAALGRRSSP